MIEAKRRKGWDAIVSLEMQGNYRGRICSVSHGTDSYRFMISFFDDGNVRTFLELD